MSTPPIDRVPPIFGDDFWKIVRPVSSNEEQLVPEEQLAPSAPDFDDTLPLIPFAYPSLDREDFFENPDKIKLINEVIEKEKNEINLILQGSINGKKFPDNLSEREAKIESIITNNGITTNKNPNFFLGINPIDLTPIFESCAAQAEIDSAEELIQTVLNDYNLQGPSLTAQKFNQCLRCAIGDALLTKYRDLFKEKFIMTGTISQDGFNTVSAKIYSIYQCDVNVKFHLLIGAFNLSEDPFACQTLRNQLEAEKSAQAALPVRGFFSFLQSGPTRSSEICKKIDKKIETIAWAEQEWNSLFPPTQQVPVQGQLIESPILEVPAELQSTVENLILSTPPEEVIVAPAQVPEPTPAVKTVRPQEPLPPVVAAPAAQIPAAPRIYSTDFNIPLVSYINIAFANCLQANRDDLNVWNSLPPLARLDALKHCYYLSNYRGKAEQIAARLFKTVTEIGNQIKSLENNAQLLPQAKTRLSHAFIEKGEALLRLYYSSNRDKFFAEIQSLPKETLFLQYVYEMAKEAGVHIEPWDYHFAENNWNKITMMNLSVQALERCLHTDS